MTATSPALRRYRLMADLVEDCLDRIEGIADGPGDDETKRSRSKARVDAFLRKRPHLIDNLRTDLTIRTTTSTTISMPARRLLEEMREYAETRREQASMMRTSTTPIHSLR
jgi:hypothetical protein